MKTALLDTNVLLALAWPNHQHHGRATRWFDAEHKFGWATCAPTQLSFVRLSSNPAFTTDYVTPSEAATLLREWTGNRFHHFWASRPGDDPSIFKNAFGHNQVNDAWLVHIASINRGRLITFDGALTAHPKGSAVVEALLA
jgi:toxin-antitoxin system PIN domain toxin